MTEKRDTPLNIKLLKKMRKRIAEKPLSYYQGYWALHDDDAPCGTTACLAGEAIICSERTQKAGLEKLWGTMNADWHRNGPSITAQKLLGLTNGEADAVFSAYPSWPEPFGTHFAKARGPKAKAEVAVAYLDHIIKTGKVLE